MIFNSIFKCGEMLLSFLGLLRGGGRAETDCFNKVWNQVTVSLHSLDCYEGEAARSAARARLRE